MPWGVQTTEIPEPIWIERRAVRLGLHIRDAVRTEYTFAVCRDGDEAERVVKFRFENDMVFFDRAKAIHRHYYQFFIVEPGVEVTGRVL